MSQDSPTFILAKGVTKAYFHNRHERGFTEPISPLGVKEAETTLLVEAKGFSIGCNFSAGKQFGLHLK